MKVKIFKPINVTRIIQVSFVAAFAVVAMSCETVSQEELVSTPELGKSASESLRQGAPQMGMEPIAQIAINAGFSELVGALTYVDTAMNAGLVDLFMNSNDQYTVFAPTNTAFLNLYTALSVSSITDLPASLVYDVLLYHVTDGRRASNSVVPRMNPKTIETLLGSTFTVSSTAVINAIGNTANITAADISASNGIIHVIDAVILPVN